MTRALSLVNGIPRMIDVSAGTVTTYDETLLVVSSGAGAGEINVSDAEASDAITLPNSGNYEDVELQVFLNGKLINVTTDYDYVGSGTRTQIALKFDAEVDDIIRFYKQS